MKKLFPIGVFALAVLLVVAGAGLRIYAIDLRYQIDGKIDALVQEQQQAEVQANALQSRLEREVIEMRDQVTRVPITTCLFKGLVPKCTVKYRELRTKVPQVIGREKDPEVVAQIDAISAKISSAADMIDHLTKRQEQIQNLADVDKESFRGFLSLVVLLAALYVILSRSYNGESQKWAYGAVGTILGYWFGV